MNIKFIGKYDEEDESLSPISFWCMETRYDFEIVYEDNEDLNIFENELKLNLENQFALDITNNQHDKR